MLILNSYVCFKIHGQRVLNIEAQLKLILPFNSLVTSLSNFHNQFPWHKLLRLLLLSYLAIVGLSQLPKSQQNALLQFYNNTNGPNWYNCTWNRSVIQLSTPLPSNSLCGITINTTNTASTRYQTVTSITFNKFTNLSGTIPSETSFISSFPNLTQLAIVDNPSLYGTIPSSLCKLSQFHYLQIENVSISGTIPNCLFSTKTSYNYSFYVANTNINGSIPKSICTKSSLQTYTLWS